MISNINLKFHSRNIGWMQCLEEYKILYFSFHNFLLISRWFRRLCLLLVRIYIFIQNVCILYLWWQKKYNWWMKVCIWIVLHWLAQLFFKKNEVLQQLRCCYYGCLDCCLSHLKTLLFISEWIVFKLGHNNPLDMTFKVSQSWPWLKNDLALQVEITAKICLFIIGRYLIINGWILSILAPKTVLYKTYK